VAVSLVGSISKLGWRVFVWLLFVLPVLAAYFRPWLGLTVLALASMVEIWLAWNWHSFRCSQFLVLTHLPSSETRRRAVKSVRSQACISTDELQSFRRRWQIFKVTSFAATGIAVSTVLSPFVSAFHLCVTTVTASVFLVLGLILYGAAGASFVSLRMFVEPLNLVAWRDQTNATQGVMSFFLRVFLIKKKDETPGNAIVPSLIVVMAFTLFLGGLASASPRLNSSLQPHGTPSHHQTSSQNSTATSTSTTAAKSTTSTSSPASTTSTPSTAPSPAMNCTSVGTTLMTALPVVGSTVSEEYANNATALQCLSTTTGGAPLVVSWGDLSAVDFTTSQGTQVTGSIVFDQAGDAATVLSTETAFTQAAQTQSTLRYITDVAVIHGAQVRLGVLAGGGCVLGLRADSEEAWTIIPPGEAPAVLSIFLGMVEIGRPMGGGVFKFSYGQPSITVTVGSDNKVMVNGADPKLTTHSEQVHECPAISTITGAQLAGPPAEP
jgi:hypothetical protein